MSLTLIQGCPRSGTTLLNRVLNTHANVAITNEIDLLNIKRDIDEVVFAKLWKLERNSIDRSQSEREGWNLNEVREFLPENTEIVSKFLRDLCSSIYPNREILHYGDKTPTYYMYSADQLVEIAAKQEIKIIHVTRSFDDVLSSIARRTRQSIAGKDTWRSIVTRRDAIWHWCYAWNRRKHFASHPNVRFLDLNYESFIANSEEGTAVIANFLQVTNEFDATFVKETPLSHVKRKGEIDTLPSMPDVRRLPLLLDGHYDVLPLPKELLFNRVERRFKKGLISWRRGD